MKYYLNNKLKMSKVRVQCSGSIRLDYFLAGCVLSPGTTGPNTRGIENYRNSNKRLCLLRW